MASSVNALLRPRAAQLPWHSLLLVVAGGTALAILVLAQRVEARLALYWALGLGVGLVLQRGRLCFAGAFRDLFLMRNGTMMRAIIVGLALMAPVFALIEARAVPEPSFGAVVARAHGAAVATAGYIGPTPQGDSLRPAEQRLAAAGGRGRPGGTERGCLSGRHAAGRDGRACSLGRSRRRPGWPGGAGAARGRRAG